MDEGREADALAKTLQAYRTVQRNDQRMRQLASSGDRVAIDVRMGRTSGAIRDFGAFDAALSALTAVHQDAFDEAIKDADGGLRGWNAVPPCGAAVIALLVLAGSVPGWPSSADRRRASHARHTSDRRPADRRAAGGLRPRRHRGGVRRSKDSLVIGVKADQPALGVKRPDGTYEGFDVDVATYIAGRMGVPKSRIRWRTTNSSVREDALAKGTVDMIVATYSITAKRKMKVTFLGPYYVAHQDTFVRPDAASIQNVRDLKGKRICEVTGSNSWRRVIEERHVAARPVTVGTYGACMDALAAGKLDAVSTDDLILAGFAAGRPGGSSTRRSPTRSTASA